MSSLPSSTFGPKARLLLLSFGSTPGSLTASAGGAAGVEDFSVDVPMFSTEAVETGLTAVEVAASSAPVDFSSAVACASYLGGQANCPKNIQRCDDCVTFDTYCGLVKVCRTYRQPTAASRKACQGNQD
jgi:hypothetical protein